MIREEELKVQRLQEENDVLKAQLAEMTRLGPQQQSEAIVRLRKQLAYVMKVIDELRTALEKAKKQ